MPYITDHKQKFDDLRINIKDKDELRRKSNGWNSIIFSYEPEEEHLYIEEAQKLFKDDGAFIDISQLLVKIIDEEGWDSFKEFYKTMEKSPHKVFHDKDAQETDLFDMIITEIEEACKDNKIPFLIRTGCLYGTGIENVNIMEHKTVMNLQQPVVIFYCDLSL